MVPADTAAGKRERREDLARSRGRNL